MASIYKRLKLKLKLKIEIERVLKLHVVSRMCSTFIATDHLSSLELQQLPRLPVSFCLSMCITIN